MKVKLGDHLDFSSGRSMLERQSAGRIPVYGANGPIGYAAEHNASGPLIVLGRVGSYCGSVRYCDSDVWVTDNALVCRAKEPAETRYWYYALQTCRLNEQRSGSGQPLLNQAIVRDISVWTVSPGRRRPIGQLLGALDEKIAANERVIEAAEALMVATVEPISQYVPLSSVASRPAIIFNPGQFDDTVALFSFSAFDKAARPELVGSRSIKSGKFLLPAPCVLFAKLNPRIPRIWNVMRLPSEMALASTEFVVLQPMGVDTSTLWSALRQPDVSHILQQQVSGTSGSRQRLQPGDLLQVPVRDVRRLSAAAVQTVAHLGALCHQRRTESLRLSALRDHLVPLLVSGKIQVENGRLRR